jgi:hypothetical protein
MNLVRQKVERGIKEKEIVQKKEVLKRKIELLILTVKRKAKRTAKKSVLLRFLVMMQMISVVKKKRRTGLNQKKKPREVKKMKNDIIQNMRLSKDKLKKRKTRKMNLSQFPRQESTLKYLKSVVI